MKIIQIGNLSFEIIDGEPWLLADSQEYLNTRWGRVVSRLSRKKPKT
jgi:hypothetical protein